MRFITEFHIGDSDWVKPHFLAEKRKSIFGMEMGEQIATTFQWQNPVNNNPTRFKLEIEAFPMDKWVEFKRKLFSHIEFYEGNVSGTHILGLIKELEFNGKPSGDAK